MGFDTSMMLHAIPAFLLPIIIDCMRRVLNQISLSIKENDMKQTLLTEACLQNEIIRTKMWLIKFKTKKMKIMKNFITVALAALVISTAASAQKPIFGFNGGTAISSFREKGEGETYTAESRVGFTAGVVADIPLNKSVSFQPGLQFTKKGGADKRQHTGIRLELHDDAELH